MSTNEGIDGFRGSVEQTEIYFSSCLRGNEQQQKSYPIKIISF